MSDRKLPPDDKPDDMLDPLNDLFHQKGIPSNKPKKDVELHKLTCTNRVYYKTAVGNYDSAYLGDLEALLSLSGVAVPADPDDRAELLKQYKEQLLRDSVVHYAGGIAGCRPGVIETDDGRKILVTEDSGWIEPVAGTWDLLKGFLEAVFGPAVEHLYSWVKFALEDIRTCREVGPWKANLRQSQAVIVVGPPNCGKTLWATLLRHLLGGKVVDPYAYFSGETRFNEELPTAPLLLMDDVTESISQRNRVRLTQALKQILVSASQRVEAKGQKPIQLKACQRIMMLANEDSLETLPLFLESFRDKVMLFEASRKDQFPAWESQEDKGRWFQSLLDCLPAFSYFLLNEYVVPPEHYNARYGVTAYHDERLLPLLDDGDDVDFIAGMFKFAIVQSHPKQGLQALNSKLSFSWEGMSRELFSLVANHCNPKLVDRLVPTPQRVGFKLASLEQFEPESFIRGRRTRGNVKWKVQVELTQSKLDELKRTFDSSPLADL